jgi:hypothetical protein
VRYLNLEEIIGEFTAVKSYTEKSIWAECDVLVQAHDDGFTIEAIKRQIAHAARCSSRLVYDRYKTGRVFPPEHRDTSLSPEIHRICASQVDLRENNPDYTPAYDWLAVAAENEYSTRKLSKAIRASGGNPDKDKPVYLLDDVEAEIADYDYKDDWITLRLFGELPRVLLGDLVIVTIVKRAQVQAPSAELVRKEPETTPINLDEIPF